MMASRGMGDINPSKMPGGKKKARRDDTDFTQYKKGGKVSRYAQGGVSDEPIPVSNDFRVVGGKYMYNNQELSKEDFDRRKAAVDARMRQMRGPDTSRMSPRDRTKSAFDELEAEIQKNREKPYKKGGEVWDRPRPKDLGKPKKLSSAKKSAAKAAAKAAGRPYPNLIDNMRMARK